MTECAGNGGSTLYWTARPTPLPTGWIWKGAVRQLLFPAADLPAGTVASMANNEKNAPVARSQSEHRLRRRLESNPHFLFDSSVVAVEDKGGLAG